ncbi:MAG: hypothetical protein JXA33_00085 [Anaerolineae bacterium]|nr:hypothetical protein [Anaerolineae bacterium]
MTIATTTLTTYRGVIEKDGVVRLRHTPPLPVGTEVLVVAAQPVPTLEEQRHRLAALPPEEWREPFDAVRAAWDASKPVPDEDALLGDEELVELIHTAQQEEA